MSDLAIYESIPKSCASSIDGIIVDKSRLPKGATFEVINPDPLIVWRFDKVEKGQEVVIGYTIKNRLVELPRTLVVENDDGTLVVNEALMCRNDNQPQTIPLAQRIGISLWFYIIPLMIVVMIPLFVFFFSRFGKRPPETPPMESHKHFPSLRGE